MATIDDIRIALKALIAAGLRNPPDRETLVDMAETWPQLLGDVPGEALMQGANDIAITDEFWPTIRRVREAAFQAQIHNGQSAAPNPWKKETHTVKYFNWVARVIGGHWFCFESDSTRPPKTLASDFPPEIEERLREIETRTNGVYGPAEYDEIDALTGPTLRRLGSI